MLKKARDVLNLKYKENFYYENFSSDNLNTYNIVWSNPKFADKYFIILKNLNIFI